MNDIDRAIEDFNFICGEYHTCKETCIRNNCSNIFHQLQLFKKLQKQIREAKEEAEKELEAMKKCKERTWLNIDIKLIQERIDIYKKMLEGGS